MEYAELAAELLRNMQSLHKAGADSKHFNEIFQGEGFVLHYIALRGGNVLPGEISNAMDVSSARVAAALNNLENKGMITRRMDKKDRRKILVDITQEGKELAEKQYHTAIEKAAEILALLGENDAKEYVRITGRLAEVSERIIECKFRTI